MLQLILAFLVMVNNLFFFKGGGGAFDFWKIMIAREKFSGMTKSPKNILKAKYRDREPFLTCLGQTMLSDDPISSQFSQKGTVQLPGGVSTGRRGDSLYVTTKILKQAKKGGTILRWVVKWILFKRDYVLFAKVGIRNFSPHLRNISDNQISCRIAD